MTWPARLAGALAQSRWTPIRKIAAAALAGFVGWAGWAAWLAGTGDLDLEAALRGAGLAALPVIIGYWVPSRAAEGPVEGLPGSRANGQKY